MRCIINRDSNCAQLPQCNNTQKTSHFSHPHTGKLFPINSIITCASTHVIYLIRCPCGLAYVGKTTRKLKQRMSEHKSSIRRNDRDYPVAVHFNDAHHDISSLRFCGIEQVNLPPRGGDHDKLLKQREAYWIHTLQTLAPKGLNDELLLNMFLWSLNVVSNMCILVSEEHYRLLYPAPDSFGYILTCTHITRFIQQCDLSIVSICICMYLYCTLLSPRWGSYGA